jgi:AcrR family transcriptional regulator
MSRNNETEQLREKLIIAGIRELEEHGLNDFSLRRVAVACEVSCAAPYRHFKSKDDLIIGIINYINSRWIMLQDQISAAFPSDKKRRLIEIGVAHIRFWIANPNFRSIILMDDQGENSQRREERKKISDSIEREISAYCSEKSVSDADYARISYAFRALIYGTVLLLGNGEIENDQVTIDNIKRQFSDILP